ncbi:MAG: chemotaxis-specific protein-glutamate methyltransferase CheB [Persicimonas sp.]
MSIRVFIVDDSAVSRMALRRLVEQDSQMEVVGEATNGKRAIEAIPNTEVDIVLMDLMMPVMDGFDATRWLMANAPLPILLISDLVGRDSALNFRAVDAGALEVVRKPSAAELGEPRVVRKLHQLIRILSDVPVVTRRFGRRRTAPAENLGLEESEDTRPEAFPRRVSLVAIGASTGGPSAIAELLRNLNEPPPWPVIILQHITRNFASGMARWLGDVSELDVQIVSERTPMVKGGVYVAPDDADLVIEGDSLVPKNDPNRMVSYPSIDTTFDSIAHSTWASESLAILMTGMGSDGARGLKALRDAGGWTIAQDKESSTVWGMPRAAVEMAAAQEVLSLAIIAERLNTIKGKND